MTNDFNKITEAAKLKVDFGGSKCRRRHSWLFGGRSSHLGKR